VELTVAGDGPDRNRLAAIAGESGCRTSVSWLGAVDHRRVRELLAEADVFVLPCRTDRNGDRDGIPVALMEAMACGVASIGGDLPAIAELIENGASGMLVDGNNADELAGRIAELAENGELRRRLGEAGRRRVIEEFSTEANMAKMRRAIQEAIGEAADDDGGAAIASAGGGVAAAAGAAPSRRYCLITPCRDEEKFARRTLESVTKQTNPPALWVIVDDGSTDSTPAILAEYAAKYPYIRVMRREDRGFRKLGGGVIDAFYFGYDTIDPSQFDYVCKLDLDLEFPPDYFSNLMDRMERQPRLGALSGKPYYTDPASGGPVLEMCGDEHCVGMVKFYRRECFAEIGGFVRELMWDGIDGHRCRMLGWMSASSGDEALRFEHLRPMGTSHKGWWTGRVRHGVGQYFMGTGVAYMMASAIGRVGHPPVVMGSAAHLWGYFKSMIERRPRYGDAAFRTFLKRYQWACLAHGKERATRDCDAAGEAVWRRAHGSIPRIGEVSKTA
jgi:glycosyltransferase involved in cell wall biosynthesis